jgi:predicted  nucleic acid-binding Zn-ribbon protein
MVKLNIENLLILQERDQEVRRLKDLLTSIPLGIQANEAEFQAEKDALESSKSKLQGLEVQRNDLDTQVGSAEEQINKYKNQQLQVKKNEEFQALTHEIELSQKKVLVWEEEEIGLLLDIDAEAEVFKKRESVFDETVAKIREKITSLESRNVEVDKQLIDAKANYEASKGGVEVSLFKRYDRLTEATKMPVVVPIEHQTCKGCHLRVSTDTSVQTRRGEELTTCDNCGRIIYLAS